MATKGATTVVVTFVVLLFVAMACVVVQARSTIDITETTKSRTTGVNLLGRHSSSAAAAAVEQAIIYPQAGCRCCFFKYVGRFLQCGTVCCQDGCCN